MSKWCCQVCGHVYDSTEGEDDAGVAPGAPFEELPADWPCPDCGAIKSNFKQVD